MGLGKGAHSCVRRKEFTRNGCWEKKLQKGKIYEASNDAWGQGGTNRDEPKKLFAVPPNGRTLQRRG